MGTTVQIVVEQSYGKATKVKLPLAEWIGEYLRTCNLQVMERGTAAKMKVTVRGEPISASEKKVDYLYASISGSIVVLANSTQVCEETFEGSNRPGLRPGGFFVPPVLKLPGITPSYEKDPNKAPFAQVLMDESNFGAALVNAVAHAWGVEQVVRGLRCKFKENMRDLTSELIALNKRDELVPKIESLLSDSDVLTRTYAAKTLGRMEAKQSVERLLSMVRDREAKVRKMAAWALGQVGDSRAAQAVADLLADDNRWVREEAARALGSVGIPDVVSAVVQAASVEKDKEVLVLELEAIGKIGDVNAAGFVVSFLNHPDEDVQTASIWALGNLGNEQTVPRLVQKLQSPQPSVVQSALSALKAIGSNACVEAILPLLQHKDNSIVQSALSALRDIGSSTCVKAVLPLLQHKEESIREAAAQTLGALGDNKVTGELVVLLQDESSQVRYAALGALARVGTPEALGILEKMAQNDSSDEVREAAGRAVSAIKFRGGGTDRTRWETPSSAAWKRVQATAENVLAWITAQGRTPLSEAKLGNKVALVKASGDAQAVSADEVIAWLQAHQPATTGEAEGALRIAYIDPDPASMVEEKLPGKRDPRRSCVVVAKLPDGVPCLVALVYEKDTWTLRAIALGEGSLNDSGEITSRTAGSLAELISNNLITSASACALVITPDYAEPSIAVGSQGVKSALEHLNNINQETGNTNLMYRRGRSPIVDGKQWQWTGRSSLACGTVHLCREGPIAHLATLHLWALADGTATLFFISELRWCCQDAQDEYMLYGNVK